MRCRTPAPRADAVSVPRSSKSRPTATRAPSTATSRAGKAFASLPEGLFANVPSRLIVFDSAHELSESIGAETSIVILDADLLAQALEAMIERVASAAPLASCVVMTTRTLGMPR